MGLFRDLWAFARLGSEQRSLLTAGILSQTLLGRGLGGDISAAAKVSPHNSMGITAVYACVKVLAETVASLPINVYERMPDGGRRLAREHYAYNLLALTPNGEATSHEIREYLMAAMCLWGNGYFYTPRNAAGEITEMWPIPPGNVTVYRGNKGELLYRVAMPEAIQKVTGKQNWTWDAYNVLHFRGMTVDGVMGISPIGENRRTIGMYVSAQEYGSKFYDNGARPAGVLEYDKKLKDDDYDRLVSQINARYHGVENAHKLMLLEHGVTYRPISIPPHDAQYIETRKFSLQDIARIYNIPPHMIGDLENATYSNIEHQSISFVTNTLMPWLSRIEQSLNSRFLRPAESERYFVEFNTNALVRGDIGTRFSAYATARQWGWMSPNDVRKRENMDAVEGGDVLHQPLNMIPLNSQLPGADQGQNSSESRDYEVRKFLRLEMRADDVAKNRLKLAKNWRPVLRDAIGRVFRREASDIGRQARKHFKTRNMDEFVDWLREFYEGHQEFVIRVILPVLLSYGEMVVDLAAQEAGADPDDKLNYENFIRAYVENFATRHGQISLTRLITALEGAAVDSEDQLQAVEDVISSFENEDGPATNEAKNESNRLSNALALVIYERYGFSSKTWVANSPSCPYCEALDGVTIQIKEQFIHGGEPQDGEGTDEKLTISRSISHPPAHNGCDCMVTAGR